jgi:pimeloyl-ACP methyl ester carboxylesterase
MVPPAVPLDVVQRTPIEDGPAMGALVVLVHGSMDRASSFRRVTAELLDWTVVSYDRRGYAGSVGSKPSALFDTQVDDLLEVLAERVAVGVGHSLGGDVVLAAAQRRPDLIDTAVVFEPPQPWLESWRANSAGAAAVGTDDTRSPEDAAEAFMRRVVGDDVWDRLPSATRRQRLAEGDALVADLRSLRSVPPPFDPAEVTIPVVVGCGTRSRAHHQEGTRLLAGQLPRGELVVIEGSTHGAHLSHPALFAGLVRRALERRDPSSPATPDCR